MISNAAQKFFAIALCSTSIAFAPSSFAKKEHRPFAEMQGDCDNYKTPLSKEFSLWASKATTTVSAKDATENGKISLDTKTLLTLHPTAAVTLLAAPEKKFPVKANSHAGVIRFSAPDDGNYLVSLGAKTWVDLVDSESKKLIEAQKFEMQTKCSKIFKSVNFRLEKNKDYLLQISSSPKSEVEVLLSKVE